jgi:carbamoyltransferase
VRDKTIRPQLVNKKANNQYYELINEFYKLTKIPVLLNNSFNLHGLPIVNSPSDAANIFLKSGLNRLLLNNFLVLKKF